MTYFGFFEIGGPIYAVGLTEVDTFQDGMAARANALKDAVVDPESPKFFQVNVFEITEALYNAVKKYGPNRPYSVTDGIYDCP